MELPSFLQTAQSLLQENSLSVQFSASTSFSFPVLAMRGETLLDAMFLYVQPAEGVVRGNRPFGWVLLKSDSGEVVLLSDCKAFDFIDTARYPLGSPVDLSLPQPLEPGEHANLYGELYEAYDRLRAFAFCDSPGAIQRAVMDTYRRLFSTLVPVGHYPFYKALAPEFLGWLGISLPGGEISGDPGEGGKDEAGVPVEVAPQPEAVPRPEEEPVQQSVLEQLQALARMFEDKIALDAHRERLFDSLHAELQSYKNGLLEKLTAAVELDVIKLIDDMEKSLAACRKWEYSEENYCRLLDLLEGFCEDLCDLLYRQGVEPFSVAGDAVDIQRQKILSVAAAEDPALDKRVAKRLARGWEKDGKVLRPERVVVYVAERGRQKVTVEEGNR